MSDPASPSTPLDTAVTPATAGGTPITFVPRNIWRVGLVIMGLTFLYLGLRFLLEDGGTVIFTLLIVGSPPSPWRRRWTDCPAT